MRRHLVLLGLGPTHHALLIRLGRRSPADLDVTLVTRQRAWVERDAVLRKVALGQPLNDVPKDLSELVREHGIRLVAQPVVAVEAAQKRLHLDDDQYLRFDWLSVETEPLQNRNAIETVLPGARVNGLFIHPLDELVRLWPRVQELANSQPLRFVVISSNATRTEAIQAMEWAFALRQAWPKAAISWVAGSDPLIWASPRLQGALRRALAHRRITLLADVVHRVKPDELHLASGARLVCDVPLLAGPTQTPVWLAASDLTLDKTGEISPAPGFMHVLGAAQAGGNASRLESDIRRLARNQRPAAAKASTRTPLVIRTEPGMALAEVWGWVLGKSRAGGRVAGILFRR